MKESSFLPHNHIQNCVVYTGTHDNITARGWYDKQASDAEKKHVENYVGMKLTAKNVHEIFLRMGMMSVANLCVFPIQDVIGLGAEAMMNIPATSKNNWEWRLQKKLLTKKTEEFLGELTEMYGRKLIKL